MTIMLPIYTISDLRYKAREVLQRLREQPIVLTQRGRPRAVLLDYEAYNEMTERQQVLEEARDAFLLQRATETAQKYLPFSALVEQYEALFGEKLELPTENPGV